MKCLMVVAVMILGGCKSTMMVTGLRHPPTNPNAVVDLSLPPQQYQEVGQLFVDAYTNQATLADFKLHTMAAKLGANAIIVGPNAVVMESDHRGNPEKPRIAKMTTFTAEAIVVPASDPILTVKD
ncbi:MAG TPA: hypothetical protein VGL42_09800 [Opitutaceae bacterium]